MNSSYTNPVNIGNNHEITINELIRISTQVLDSNIPIVTSPSLENPKRRCPDLTLAKKYTRLVSYYYSWRRACIYV